MSLPFLHSPADIVRWLLVGIGVGTDPTLSVLQPWPVYAADEPDEPDNCLTVYDTTPQDDGRVHTDGEVLRMHGFQLRIRAVDHPTGAAKLYAAQVTMTEANVGRTVSIGTARYTVFALSKPSVGMLGKDMPNTARKLFTINALASIRRVA